MNHSDDEYQFFSYSNVKFPFRKSTPKFYGFVIIRMKLSSNIDRDQDMDDVRSGNKFKILKGGRTIEPSDMEARETVNGKKSKRILAVNRFVETESTPAVRFDRLISSYYGQKSLEQDTASVEACQTSGPSSEELAMTILTSEVGEARQVLLKLNILENELATDMDMAAPVDRKHLLMFAGLKADLIGLMARIDQA